MSTLGTGQPDIVALAPPQTRLAALGQGISLATILAIGLIGFVVLGPFMWLDGRLREKQ